MLRKIAKVALVLASSAVVIPYAVALLAEMLYGWSPNPRKRYYRALHPRKVYALNYALIMELPKILYIGLCNKWTRYYNDCPEERLMKVIIKLNKLCIYFCVCSVILLLNLLFVKICLKYVTK